LQLRPFFFAQRSSPLRQFKPPRRLPTTRRKAKRQARGLRRAAIIAGTRLRAARTIAATTAKQPGNKGRRKQEFSVAKKAELPKEKGKPGGFPFSNLLYRLRSRANFARVS
jgi:hypothetical protein